MALPTRLDRSIYFATEHGEPGDATRYWQDGLAFDAHGELVDSRLTEDQRARLDTQRAKTPADPGQADAPPRRDRPEQAVPESDFLPGDGEANLELWLKGEKKYGAGKVLAAARARFNKSFTNFTDLVDFLVYDQRLMPASEVTPRLRPKDLGG